MFAHLHVRSAYSWGFGTATPAELVERAARLGMSALALTDRDTLMGVPTFLAACEDHAVSPVVGAEITMKGGGHLVLLVESERGYRNLCLLITSYRCSSENRKRPLCPLETVLEHSEGLLCIACSDVPEPQIHRILEALDEGRLYLELANDLTAGSRRRVRERHAFARSRGVPTVVTNEVAYPVRQDHRLHEVLAASADLSPLPPPGYRSTDQLYLKSAKQMERLFEDYPDALRNTARVAEQCGGAVKKTGRALMPIVLTCCNESAERKLVSLAVAGARKRYGPDEMPEVKVRLRRELSCIMELGFADYFLLAREAVDIARAEGTPVTGRGSSANSIVAHCLGITQPEPISNRLLFERFLHEDREDPPDIDLDFSSTGREMVRKKLIRRYDHLGVAGTATRQTMSLRGAVRVAARALGHTPFEINALAKGVPIRFQDRGQTYNPISGWDEVLGEPSMRDRPLQDRERYALLMDLSWRLQGKLLQPSTHSGGLVFGTEALHLSEIVPLEPSDQDGLLRVQADKDDLELLGLPKLDLLILRMHDALHRAGELVSERLIREGRIAEERRINPLAPPPDDKATYTLIRTGKNIGMFQVESPGQMSLSQRLKPRRFEDLIAQISLFRPGPIQGDLVTPYILRKNTKEPYEVILEQLDEVLRPTYGVLVYQEQVLEVASVVAGFSLKDGDLLRRAMTKNRGRGAMDSIREEFIGRAVERSVPSRKAREVFGWIEGFSSYGFPKAHGASFAAITYASAYMRCHYPAEFFCSVLNSQKMGFFSPRTVLNEARRVGVAVLSPDIHLSGDDCTVEEDGAAIRVGLSYCKGLPEHAMEDIIRERENSPFASVSDLYRRTGVARDSIDRLIGGGYLDSLTTPTASVARARARLKDDARKLPEKRRSEAQPEIPIHPASWWYRSVRRDTETLLMSSGDIQDEEWRVLGLNVLAHPLASYRAALGRMRAVPAADVASLPHRTRARVAGLLECLQRPPTKSGAVVHFLLIEDESGVLQATIFESVYRRYGHVLHQSGAYLLDGTVEHDSRRGTSYLVSRIRSLDEVLEGAAANAPESVPAGSGAFVRARRKDRRAG